MLQAPEFHRPPFDFLTFEQDGLPAAGVNIGWRKIFQALVIALMVVVRDEGIDLRFKISGQEIVLRKRCERPTDLTGSLSALFRRALRFGLEQSFGTNGAAFVGFGWEQHKPA